jgi:putrescine---pyruvate transaminase
MWTEQGKKLMDGFAGLAVGNVGHGRREIAEAIAEQTVKLAYYPTTRQFSNRPAAQLAAKLASLTPGDLDLTMFAVSGSEANERSMQIARHYWMAPRQGGGRDALPEGVGPRRDRLPARQRAAPGATPLHHPRRSTRSSTSPRPQSTTWSARRRADPTQPRRRPPNR